MNSFFQCTLAILLAANQANNSKTTHPSLDEQIQKEAKAVRSLSDKIDKLEDEIKADNDELSLLSKQVAQAQVNLMRVQQEQVNMENEALRQLLRENSNSIYSYNYQEAAMVTRKNAIEELRKEVQRRKLYLDEIEKQGFESDALKRARSNYLQSLTQLQLEEFQYENEIAEINTKKIEDEQRSFWRMRASQNDLRSQNELAQKRARDELKEAQTTYESLQQKRATDEAILEETQDQYMALKRDYDVLQAQRSQTQNKNNKQRNHSA